MKILIKINVPWNLFFLSRTWMGYGPYHMDFSCKSDFHENMRNMRHVLESLGACFISRDQIKPGNVNIAKKTSQKNIKINAWGWLESLSGLALRTRRYHLCYKIRLLPLKHPFHYLHPFIEGFIFNEARRPTPLC